MVTLPPPHAQRRTSFWKYLLLGPLLGLLFGFGILAWFLHAATQGVWDRVATVVSGRPLHIDTTQPTVVSRIQRLARLETVTYTMDKVVEGDREGRVLPEFLTGDKILLTVHGEAIAGIDLHQLTPADVQVSGSSVHLHLPAAQIFTVTLDDEKTRVYSRYTGILVPADPNLESEVRAKAEQDLRQSALAAGILNTAHQNACSTVTTMLLGLGFHQVDCS
ncbi:DUF4230 domain-containing protein [Paracidobacterium acidisoli]|uniref:DUF4230 domain-containing protein n=1 Tax=Paracidobacterium acidisoli TaxID=2303751 RepID=A0A372IPB6_9BACT|nr:DUF4230 domain-containing protein [Paracidobacterium acidisoli]MBT9331119.1 DUF4230 domain-containing protein [Paracidobacterium acidisoli]